MADKTKMHIGIPEMFNPDVHYSPPDIPDDESVTGQTTDENSIRIVNLLEENSKAARKTFVVSVMTLIAAVAAVIIAIIGL